VIISFAEDDKLIVYPNNTEISEYINKIKMYRLNQKLGELFAYTINKEANKIEQTWIFNFRNMKEIVLSIEEPVYKTIPRVDKVIIADKVFNKYKEEFLPAITLHFDIDQINLYLINQKTGDIILSKVLTEGYLNKIPLVEVYENAMAIVLPFEEGNKLLLVEIFQASEIADTNDKDNAKIGSIEDLIYPVITEIRIKRKVKAIKLLQIDQVEYMVFLDDKNVLRIIKTEDLERGSANEMTKEKIKELQLPENLIFKEPTVIEYDEKTGNAVVHGFDIYSFQLL